MPILWLWGLLLIASPQPSPDLIDSLLARIGWTREDLGFQPKATWPRFPDPTDLPYTLRFFEDLYAQPLEIYTFTKTFSHAAQAYLDPEFRAKQHQGLYRLVYALGVDPWLTGFRSYGANIHHISDDTLGDPLRRGCERLWTLAGAQPPGPTFGGQYGEVRAPWEDFCTASDSILPPFLYRAVGTYLEDLADALYWLQVARRNLRPDLAQKVFRIRDLQTTQPDGSVYYPEIDDAFRQMDWHSLLYAALKMIEATEDFVAAVETVASPGTFRLSLETPWGEILLTGSGSDTLRSSDPLLLLDFGGNDVYPGIVAATPAPDRPLSIALDLGGNDLYETDEGLTQGAAILGVGLLWDHQGNDQYFAGTISQGAAQLGFGLLVDENGEDTYRATEVAQGAGLLGVAGLVDLGGNDTYYLYGNGQGDGEFGGIGFLVDAQGNDHYEAEPLSSVFDRGDYHSRFKINANNAQGFGGGRRGDGSDGHSWAGGMGILVDLEGDDTYKSGNWSLGTGYWFGVGLLVDEQGNDVYESCYFTQASGAHFAIGALIDEAGDDQHLLFETAGAALGFGWDFTEAFFLDRKGNDTYRARIISIGVAQIRSQAFFFDLAGNDQYEALWKTHKFGYASPRDFYQRPPKTLPYLYEVPSLALFLDLGGQDTYQALEPPEDAGPLPYKNDTLWYQPALDAPDRGHNNYGIGLDREGGHIRELELWLPSDSMQKAKP